MQRKIPRFLLISAGLTALLLLNSPAFTQPDSQSGSAAPPDTAKQRALQKLYRLEIMEKVVPRWEVEACYEKMGEEIHARHILVRISQDATPEEVERARSKADSIYSLLQAGASFADLATTLSEDPTTAGRGGDLDWFAWGRMVEEFQQAAFALQVGQISPPVKTSYGFHIIKFEERRPSATRKSFAEEEENIYNLLRQKYQAELQKAAEEYLNKLKEEHDLQWNYANIQKVLDKLNDPNVFRDSSQFANFNEAEMAWEVATYRNSLVDFNVVRVSDLEAELSKTGSRPRWHDQRDVMKLVERMIIPGFLAQRARERGLLLPAEEEK